MTENYKKPANSLYYPQSIFQNGSLQKKWNFVPSRIVAIVVASNSGRI
jgi:hypothetical protein